MWTKITFFFPDGQHVFNKSYFILTPGYDQKANKTAVLVYSYMVKTTPVH